MMHLIRRKTRKKSLRRIVLAAAILLLPAGCAPAGNDSSSAQSSGIFAEDIGDCLDKEVYQRMISEPLGADLPEIPFFNKDVVCVLSYNGLAIFDAQTGALQNCIDVQKMGYGDTQGDAAMFVRGNEEYITITAANDTEVYAYSIASDELGRLKNADAIAYTDVKRLEQVPLDGLDLSKFDTPAETAALESKDGVLVYSIPMGDLSRMQFQIYET